MSGKQKTEGVRRIWDKYKFVALVALAGAVLLLWPGGDGKTAERASPQAAALVEDGDRISVDLSRNAIHLDVDDGELARRRERWTPVKKPLEKGLLKRYAKTVSSARRGASLG